MLLKCVASVIQTSTRVEDMLLETYSKCSSEADVSPAGCGRHPAYPLTSGAACCPTKRQTTHRHTSPPACQPARPPAPALQGKGECVKEKTEATGCQGDVIAHTTVPAVITQHLVVLRPPVRMGGMIADCSVGAGTSYLLHLLVRLDT